MDWRSNAQCKGVPPDSFFPQGILGRNGISVDTMEQEVAAKLCGGCPVQNECLEWALVYQLHGVAGGLTSRQRKRIRGRRFREKEAARRIA